MSQLYFSSKKRNNGSILQIRGHYYANNRNDCFQPIGQLSPISFSAVKGNQLLITLNVPDTWCDKAGDGAWFAISVNDEIKAEVYIIVARMGNASLSHCKRLSM